MSSLHGRHPLERAEGDRKAEDRRKEGRMPTREGSEGSKDKHI